MNLENRFNLADEVARRLAEENAEEPKKQVDAKPGNFLLQEVEQRFAEENAEENAGNKNGKKKKRIIKIDGEDVEVERKEFSPDEQLESLGLVLDEINSMLEKPDDYNEKGLKRLAEIKSMIENNPNNFTEGMGEEIKTIKGEGKFYDEILNLEGDPDEEVESAKEKEKQERIRIVLEKIYDLLGGKINEKDLSDEPFTNQQAKINLIHFESLLKEDGLKMSEADLLTIESTVEIINNLPLSIKGKSVENLELPEDDEPLNLELSEDEPEETLVQKVHKMAEIAKQGDKEALAEARKNVMEAYNAQAGGKDLNQEAAKKAKKDIEKKDGRVEKISDKNLKKQEEIIKRDIIAQGIQKAWEATSGEYKEKVKEEIRKKLGEKLDGMERWEAEEMIEKATKRAFARAIDNKRKEIEKQIQDKFDRDFSFSRKAFSMMLRSGSNVDKIKFDKKDNIEYQKDDFNCTDSFEEFDDYVKNSEQQFDYGARRGLQEIQEKVEKANKKWNKKKNEAGRDLVKDAIKDEWIKKAVASLKKQKPKIANSINEEYLLENFDKIKFDKKATEKDKKEIKRYLEDKYDFLVLPEDEDLLDLEDLERDDSVMQSSQEDEDLLDLEALEAEPKNPQDEGFILTSAPSDDEDFQLAPSATLRKSQEDYQTEPHSMPETTWDLIDREIEVEEELENISKEDYKVKSGVGSMPDMMVLPLHFWEEEDGIFFKDIGNLIGRELSEEEKYGLKYKSPNGIYSREIGKLREERIEKQKQMRQESTKELQDPWEPIVKKGFFSGLRKWFSR